MNDILLAIDDDEARATAQVDSLIDLFGDEFRAHVLHVFQENIEGASMANFATVRPVENRLESAGVDYQLHERSGDIATEIIAVAEEVDADLLTIAGRKRSPAGKVLFGSVAQGVILGTDREVLVCGANTE